MKLYNFLNENGISLEEKVKIVKKDCSKFLKESNFPKNILYRGLFDNITNFKPIEILKNRNPRNTNKELSNLFDIGFKNNFNFKARSETIFTTRKN